MNVFSFFVWKIARGFCSYKQIVNVSCACEISTSRMRWCNNNQNTKSTHNWGWPLLSSHILRWTSNSFHQVQYDFHVDQPNTRLNNHIWTQIESLATTRILIPWQVIGNEYLAPRLNHHHNYRNVHFSWNTTAPYLDTTPNSNQTLTWPYPNPMRI